ncbi:inner membrane ABC transporter permease YjfF [Yersinia aldovae]|nr:inner membrane ABC transporter permease YjfF [Yersinia aldovae]
MLLVVAFGILLAHRTRFGHNVYAIRGNSVSAGLMGVPVRQTTIKIYMLSGTLAALSGIVFSLYTSAGYALAASGVELDAIAAVVIGGTLLTGGIGTLFGVLIQGLIQSYITFDGTLSSWWTKIVIGILLFSFIAIQKAMSAFYLNRRVHPKSPPLNPV